MTCDTPAVLLGKHGYYFGFVSPDLTQARVVLLLRPRWGRGDMSWRERRMDPDPKAVLFTGQLAWLWIKIEGLERVLVEHMAGLMARKLKHAHTPKLDALVEASASALEGAGVPRGRYPPPDLDPFAGRSRRGR